MSQTKAQFILQKIADLCTDVIQRESIPDNSQSFEDLRWVHFYARDLAKQCKNCAESHNETPQNVEEGEGSQNS